MSRIKSNSVLLNKMKQKLNVIHSKTAVNDKTTSIAESNCVRSQSQATNGSQLIGQQTALLTDVDLITALIRLSTRCLSANYPWKPVSWETTRLADFQQTTRGNYCPGKSLVWLAFGNSSILSSNWSFFYFWLLIIYFNEKICSRSPNSCCVERVET